MKQFQQFKRIIMREDNLSFGGIDANRLVLKVEDAAIKPYGTIISGSLRAGFIIEMSGYNLDNLLCQLLEDYGEETLLKRIKQL